MIADSPDGVVALFRARFERRRGRPAEALTALGTVAGSLAALPLVRAEEGQPHPLGAPDTYAWRTPDRPVTAAIMALMPQFYRDVWDVPKTWYMLGGSIIWLLLGNAIMFKMSNFRF